jgi:iron(III) transport system ATP-binding protein
MLSVNNLTVAYGDHTVLNNLDLELGDDEIVTLVGPTGCGKSSLLQAIAGLVPMQTGSVALGDWRVSAGSHLPPEKRQIGMVFQDFALFPHLSVQDNVAFRLKDRSRATHWLAALGLAAFADAKPAQLSGGQKQRVALARAIAHEPALILLDEPLSNLDAALKDNLRWDIRLALKEAGMPAIWVTHDQSEALSVGDRVGILNGGTLEQLAKPETAYAKPVSPFVAQFLGPANFAPGVAKGEAVITDDFGQVQSLEHFAEETAVTVLIRPEELQIDAEGELNATVTQVRYEGAHWSHTVSTQSAQSYVVLSHSRWEPGARVCLQLARPGPKTCFTAS